MAKAIRLYASIFDKRRTRVVFSNEMAEKYTEYYNKTFNHKDIRKKFVDTNDTPTHVVVGEFGLIRPIENKGS